MLSNCDGCLCLAITATCTTPCMATCRRAATKSLQHDTPIEQKHPGTEMANRVPPIRPVIDKTNLARPTANRATLTRHAIHSKRRLASKRLCGSLQHAVPSSNNSLAELASRPLVTQHGGQQTCAVKAQDVTKGQKMPLTERMISCALDSLGYPQAGPQPCEQSVCHRQHHAAPSRWSHQTVATPFSFPMALKQPLAF